MLDYLRLLRLVLRLSVRIAVTRSGISTHSRIIVLVGIVRHTLCYAPCRRGPKGQANSCAPLMVKIRIDEYAMSLRELNSTTAAIFVCMTLITYNLRNPRSFWQRIPNDLSQLPHTYDTQQHNSKPNAFPQFSFPCAHSAFRSNGSALLSRTPVCGTLTTPSEVECPPRPRHGCYDTP
jgi:hypothetical protein